MPREVRLSDFVTNLSSVSSTFQFPFTLSLINKIHNRLRTAVGDQASAQMIRKQRLRFGHMLYYYEVYIW